MTAVDTSARRQLQVVVPCFALSFLLAASIVRADVVEVAVVAGKTTTINLPSAPAEPPTLRLYVYDADMADEGTMILNGHKMALFGASALPENNEILVWVDYVVPVTYWRAGSNTLTFSYTRRDGAYRVDLVQLEYQAQADMPVVQLMKATGRAPPWLSENDDIRVRLRRNPDRVYVCSREHGAPTGRTWVAWSPGTEVVPDMSTPLAPLEACDKVFCFAADDANGTRTAKIHQACAS